MRLDRPESVPGHLEPGNRHPQLDALAAALSDRCGGQAYIRMTIPSGGKLLFCAHHGHAHETRLREMAAEIHDDSARLTETPAVAPDGER